jgi:hypothetical protein
MTIPALPGVDVRNQVLATTSGTPSANGVIDLVATADTSRTVTVTVSGTTATFLPAEPDASVLVALTDGVETSTATASFEIPPPGLINEPFCTWVSPPGGTLGGDIPLELDIEDFESDPASLTLVYSTNAGATWLPMTLDPATVGLGSYTPTDPANGFAGAANQLTGIATPGTATATWRSATDGVGSAGRVPVRLRAFTEDGTSMGAGPFSTCDADLFVDNAPLPQTPQGATLVALGHGPLLDPGGILGGTRMPLGASARLHLVGTGFQPGDPFSLTPEEGLARDAPLLVSSTLITTSLRTLPDGPDGSLAETGQNLAVSTRIALVRGALAGNFDVVVPDALVSLSADRFTVAPGGSFVLSVQIPSTVIAGSEAITAYAVDVRFDADVLTPESVQAGSAPDFAATPQSQSPRGGAEGLVVFLDPVARADLAEPVLAVARITLRVDPAALPGTRIHLWLDPTSLDTVLLTSAGNLLVPASGLGILGTSVVVE